jgi:hypothetical protein
MGTSLTKEECKATAKHGQIPPLFLHFLVVSTLPVLLVRNFSFILFIY